MLAVISPSLSSSAVAPASAYLPPTVSVTGFCPSNVMVGLVVSGAKIISIDTTSDTTSPIFALTSTVPSDIAVNTPFSAIVAIFVSLTVQFTSEVTTSLVLSL